MLPLPLAVLAHRADPWLADLLLVLATGAAALARPAGALAAGVALTVLINVLAALVLGSPWRSWRCPLAGIVGTAIGFAADGLALLLLARLAAPPERWLLATAAAEQLDDLGRRWIAPTARLGAGDEARGYASVAADFALTAPGLDTLHAASHDGERRPLPERIAGGAGHTAAGTGRGGWPRTPNAAAQFRAGSLQGAEAVAQGLRATATEIRPTPGQADPPPRALGLALLLAQLASVTLAPPRATRAAPAVSSPIPTIQLRLALQAMTCVGLATIASHLLPTSRPYRIPLTAAILTSASYGETVRKSYERVDRDSRWPDHRTTCLAAPATHPGLGGAGAPARHRRRLLRPRCRVPLVAVLADGDPVVAAAAGRPRLAALSRPAAGHADRRCHHPTGHAIGAAGARRRCRPRRHDRVPARDRRMAASRRGAPCPGPRAEPSRGSRLPGCSLRSRQCMPSQMRRC